ncbi:Polysulphide reductase NrfD [Pyrolobus fumarii 1A]|uniref:Polysulphide reductase NrfD n=1 Tax=Pyrolobus fumarii (strain DSM 11204 / 1A) TaxID=694429 RepID=G0EF55_PYRF1|nr:NrfD/PsrC family molybdoenzyme membrane anchor subunit [Pyrolobus fumarii]AEM38952.1 Polysulphide reductase NrfD [Pyrolobus fumarii 1A]
MSKVLALILIGVVLSALFAYGVYSYQVATGGAPLALAAWGAMVAGYTFFALMSGGVFDSLAIEAAILGKRDALKLARKLVWLALATLIPGILLVFADLTMMQNSMWIWLGFNPASRIAWNGVLYLLYGGFALATLLYVIMRGEESLATRTGKLLLLGGLAASILLEYNLGMAYGVNFAVPGWWAAPTGILFVVLAFLLGSAWTLLVMETIGPGGEDAVKAWEEYKKGTVLEMGLAAAALLYILLWVTVQQLAWTPASTVVSMGTGYIAAVIAVVVLAGLVPLAVAAARVKSRGTLVTVATLVIIAVLVYMIFPFNTVPQLARIDALATYASLESYVHIEEVVAELLAYTEILAVIGGFGVFALLYGLGLKLLALEPGEKPKRLIVFR